MSYNFFIVGGDKRNLLLAEKLSKNEENVKLFGFNRINDSYFANNNITKIKNLHELNNELNNPNTPNTPNNRTIFANLNVYAKDEKLSEQIKDEKLSKQIKATNSNVHKKESKLNKQISDTQIIIGAIPLTIDGKTIYAPYNDTEIDINILRNKKIIAGKIPQGLVDENSLDILKDEYFTIKNTIPTAEGAIAKAIELTDVNIDESNVMVLGFGRVGKTLCYKLKKLGANVYAEARKEKDLAWINVFGYNAVPLEKINENICKMDIIFNTIPQPILDKSKLILINKNTLIIDLASKPGGTDFESAKKLGINAILYLGIPGKIASDFEADLIEEYIYKCIKRHKL